MSPVYIVLLAVGCLGVLVGVNVIVWVKIFGNLRRLQHEMRQTIDSSGEKMVKAPEIGRYRGASAPGYGRVGGLGVVAMTSRRVLFSKAVGQSVEVALDQVSGIRTQPFNNPNRTRVFLELKTGGDVVFSFRNPDVWQQSISELSTIGKRS